MAKTTKEKIIDKALPMFLEKSYQDVTVKEISERCGITKPTFYKYVGSKDELIMELYDRTISAATGSPDRLESVPSAYEKLVIIFSTIMEDTTRYGADLFRHMMIANLQGDRGSFNMRQSFTDIAVSLIAEARENGEIGNVCEDVLSVYEGIAHMFTGFEFLWCVSQGAFPLAERFYSHMNAVLDVKEEYRGLYKKYLPEV